jgi:hypothetical protein
MQPEPARFFVLLFSDKETTRSRKARRKQGEAMGESKEKTRRRKKHELPTRAPVPD